MADCNKCGFPIMTPQAVWENGGYSHGKCPNEDKVNHPEHYKWLPVEAIEITEHFNFCMGNALKYIIRADHKGRPVEDIEKAIWYLQRELRNRQAT